jgi:predicted phage tail protein
MTSQLEFGSDGDWSGPYTATVAADKTTSDGCSAGVNRHTAFKRYEIGQEVQIKARYDGRTEVWESTVKAKDDGTCYFSTFPIAIRRQIGVGAGDDYKFWVRPVDRSQVVISERVEVTMPNEHAAELVGWLENYADYCEVADLNHAQNVRTLAEQFRSELE